MKQEMTEWQRHQLDHMQITCTLLQRDNLITQVFTVQMLFLTTSQQCQSTEGKSMQTECSEKSNLSAAVILDFSHCKCVRTFGLNFSTVIGLVSSQS